MFIETLWHGREKGERCNGCAVFLFHGWQNGGVMCYFMHTQKKSQCNFSAIRDFFDGVSQSWTS